MKAIVVGKAHQPQMTERTLRSLKYGEALLDMECCGVCHTDLHVAHAAVVITAAKQAFNSTVESVRAGDTVVAVSLPAESMDLSIPRLVLDGIHVVGSLVVTREDLKDAFQFGAEGLVVPKTQTRPMEDVQDIFKEIEEDKINGRKVIDWRH